MFFGWNKVSQKFHLTSTWLVAIGANLSALWILVANAWMQFPSGTTFNPDTARNEMTNFWDVALSPVAVNKFLHTINSGFTLAAIFVVGVSAWYLLKKRHIQIAKKSIVIASVFGFISILTTIVTGDGSAKAVAKYQPMKLAAMEGLYEGSEGAGLIAIGTLSSESADPEYDNINKVNFKIEIPNMLSFLSFGDFNAFVPGIKDLMHGNEEQNIMPVKEKIKKGNLAIQALRSYKEAKKAGNDSTAQAALQTLNTNYQYFGYGYFQNRPGELIPNIPMTFYSFHIMVILGFYFLLFFAIMMWLVYKKKIETSKVWLRIAVWTIPLAYIASEAGWIVAEMGRQPWIIQDLMPTLSAVTSIDAGAVMTTFWLFAIIFVGLAIAEVKIMLKQISIGPKEKEGGH
jgi:cytochrome d ubiquinol oxidase subunit I